MNLLKIKKLQFAKEYRIFLRKKTCLPLRFELRFSDKEADILAVEQRNLIVVRSLKKLPKK